MERYDKKEILYNAMYNAQPTFDDFRGLPGFSNEMIREHKKQLGKKVAKIFYSNNSSADDDFAKHMEPIVTFILNREEILPSRENFAFLASEYDDKAHGTDVVFGVERKNGGGSTVFSVDVATDTLLKGIDGKFKNSLDNHDGTSEITYCMHNDKRWSESDALHFVVGMSPASQNKAISKIAIANSEIRGRGTDLDTDFILLSELLEQTRMQLAILKNKPKDEKYDDRMAKLNDFLPAIRTGLCRTLEINPKEYASREESNKAFNKKYSEKCKEISAFDEVYRNIIGVTKSKKRGAEALDAQSDSE